MDCATHRLSAKPTAPAAELMRPVRACGRVELAFKRRGLTTVIADLAESGGYRAKFPAQDNHCEAVIINTGGGMTGGDSFACSIALSPGAEATVTTQSAEKIYNSSGHDCAIAVTAQIAEAASLAWLPQETLLFSGSRIRRDFRADMAGSARLLMAESLVFGRIASGEKLAYGLLQDRWRIKRGGKLIFADDLRLDGTIADLLRKRAILNDARACASLLWIAPEAEAACESLRASIDGVEGYRSLSAQGVSAWNGMLLARAADANPARLRLWVAHVTQHLLGRPLPRVWQC